MQRILMIEDDFDFAEIMVECLQSDPSFAVEEVITNLADARFKFACGGLHGVDAVLVDLQLAQSKSDPRVNASGGLELIEEMRKVHGYTGTVIVLTNSNSLQDGDRARRAGCDGYLCKHLRMGDLPSLLAELRMAIRGDVVLFSKEMRHIFVPGNEAEAAEHGT